MIDRIQRAGIVDEGSLAIQMVDAAPTKNAVQAEQAAPGSPDDGVVWDVVRERAEGDARDSWTYYAFLTLATLLAAIAVVEDSSILVVGAMVVGPEFGVVVAIGFGLAFADFRLAARGLRLLVQGFAVAIAIVVVLALVARIVGWVDGGDLTRDRPQTGFIYRPDHWSLLVAVVAGIAGVLSQTTGRATALVGVFISVTTVPAAGNLALALALWVPAEVRGSLQQLGINLAGMTVAGLATLLVLGARRANRSRPAERTIEGWYDSPPPPTRPA